MANREEKKAGFSDYNQEKVQDANDINLIPNKPEQQVEQTLSNNNPQQSAGEISSTFQNKMDAGLSDFESSKFPSSLEREKENELFDANIRFQDDDLEIGSLGDVQRDFAQGQGLGPAAEDTSIRSVGEDPVTLDASDDPIGGSIGVVVCINGKAQFANIVGQLGNRVS